MQSLALMGFGEAVQNIRQFADRGWLRKVENEQPVNTYKLIMHGSGRESIAAATASKLGIRPESLSFVWILTEEEFLS